MKPRIAWVAPYLPEPATSGGVLRIQQLATAASAQFELHLFCRGELWERRRLHSSELDMFASRHLGRDWWPRGARALPRRVRRGSPQSLWNELMAIHRERPFSAVVVEHCWAAWGAERAGLPWVLDEHNVESEYLKDWFAARRRAGAWVERELAAMRAWERQAWGRATELCCVSSADAAQMRAHRTRAPTVIANGTKMGRWVEPATRRGPVLFVGAMHHAPNAEAALRLVRGIMPIVWKSLPNATLDIVGPNPPAALQALAGDRVRVHGRVPSVASFLETCSALAFPLLRGAGSSLKVIEALAAGAPLVSTEIGARGFDLLAGEHYARADTDEDFAQALVRILGDPATMDGCCRAGRLLAERYDWSTLGALFTSVIMRAFAAAAPVQEAPGS